MTKGFKITLLIFFIVIVVGAIIAYRMFTKPRRSVENEAGIAITSAQLVSDYQQDEAAANKKYLDKTIQVSGAIGSVDKNQEGNTTVTLTSDDAMTGVYCTLKSKEASLQAGSTVVIKGICKGMLSDVRISEAIVVP